MTVILVMVLGVYSVCNSMVGATVYYLDPEQSGGTGATKKDKRTITG